MEIVWVFAPIRHAGPSYGFVVPITQRWVIPRFRVTLASRSSRGHAQVRACFSVTFSRHGRHVSGCHDGKRGDLARTNYPTCTITAVIATPACAPRHSKHPRCGMH